MAPPREKSDLRVLINHYATAYQLIHSHGKAYAVPKLPAFGPTTLAQAVGPDLRRRIMRDSQSSPKINLIGRAMADQVLDHLAAMAFDGPETPLALRSHHDDFGERVYIDLARSHGMAERMAAVSEKVLVVRPDGWELSGNAPIIFRRTSVVKPLPEPVRGGRLDELAPLLALDPAGETFACLVGWLLSLPFAGAVRPGVLLVGSPGGGKSTRLRLTASVLEPSGPETLGSSFGQNFGDDHVRALSRPVPLWDNLTSVSGKASDELCCLITGTAREGRTLYTDNDVNTVPIQRPIGLTAVGVPAGLRQDALDRLIVLDVPHVPLRLDDGELQRRFDRAHPRLLGALADAVAAALRWRKKVLPPTQFRMAAHARTLAAVDAATAAGELPGCPTGLLDAYAANHRRVKERTAAEDTFGAAVLALLDRRGGAWKGKASELLPAALMHSTGYSQGPGWPSSPRRVPEVLAHLQDGLGALGVRWQTSTVRGSTIYSFTTIPTGT